MLHVQELEKGLEGMLEQYQGIQQEEEAPPTLPANGRAGSGRRNRIASRGGHCTTYTASPMQTPCLSVMSHTAWSSVARLSIRHPQHASGTIPGLQTLHFVSATSHVQALPKHMCSHAKVRLS